MKKNEEKRIEKSKRIYEELLEKVIIPAIEQESEDELPAEELGEVVATLAQVVDSCTEAVEANTCRAERKVLRAQRKAPKHPSNNSRIFASDASNIINTMVSLASETAIPKQTMKRPLCE